MNPQSDQIRALIDEIDELLHGGSNSFVWRFSGDRARHQDALQRLRRYLTTLQTTLRIRHLPGADAFSGLDNLMHRPALHPDDFANPFAIEEDDIEDADVDVEDLDMAIFEDTEADVEADVEVNVSEALVSHRSNPSGDWLRPDSEDRSGHPANHDQATELEVRPLGYRDSDALLSQLSAELAQLREGLVGPLQNEVQQLRQQRSLLQSEVTQLEIRRAQANPSPEQDALLHQFIETLMGRLQERMVKQVATILQQALPQIVASQMSALPPAEAQQVQQLQKRANALLSNMDSTIRVFSQTLEQNVQAYQQSLSVGLERMHNLGRQGEVMVSGLVNRLAEQMEQQTALYLQAPVQVGASVAPGSAIPSSAIPSSAIPGSARSTNPFTPESEAAQRAQWEANALPSATWQSTSSSGILAGSSGAEVSHPGAAMTGAAMTGSDITDSDITDSDITDSDITDNPTRTAQAPEQRRSSEETAMSVPVRPTLDLDAFYAGFGAAPTETSPDSSPESLEETASEASSSGLERESDRHRSLEEALFDGIPDGELWTSPWEHLPVETKAQSPTPPPALAESRPDESHTIHSLKDLVNRTSQDLENLNLQATTAVMETPKTAKKKASVSRSHPPVLTLPQRPPLKTAS